MRIIAAIKAAKGLVTRYEMARDELPVKARAAVIFPVNGLRKMRKALKNNNSEATIDIVTGKSVIIGNSGLLLLRDISISGRGDMVSNIPSMPTSCSDDREFFGDFAFVLMVCLNEPFHKQQQQAGES